MGGRGLCAGTGLAGMMATVPASECQGLWLVY